MRRAQDFLKRSITVEGFHQSLSSPEHKMPPSPPIIYLRTIYYSHLLLPCRSTTGREAPGSIAVSPPRSQNLAAGHLHLPGGLSTTDFNGPQRCYHAIWTDFSMPIYVNMAEYLYVRIGFKMLIGWKMVWILLAWHHGQVRISISEYTEYNINII